MPEEQEKVACGVPCGNCRECNPITSMAERVDAYTSARSLIAGVPRSDDDPVSAHEVVQLAHWLFYGRDIMEDD